VLSAGRVVYILLSAPAIRCAGGDHVGCLVDPWAGWLLGMMVLAGSVNFRYLSVNGQAG